MFKTNWNISIRKL